MLDAKFFKGIAMNVVARYRKAIFDNKGKGANAKDVFGKEYKEYSKEYGEAKQTGTLRRQKTGFKDSTAPVLTGDLFNDFQLRKTKKDGFSFGTIAWGGKVKNLERLGRAISTDKKALPDEVEKYIMDEADKYSKKWWRDNGGDDNVHINV